MVIDDRQRSWAQREDLTSQLAADRPATTGDENARGVEVGRPNLGVDLDGVAPKQVIEADRPDLRELDLAAYQLPERRHGSDGKAQFPARFERPPDVLLLDFIERDEGREDLAGPAVILAHRLLKNTISEGGGPKAYAFLTEACLQRMSESFHLPGHTEIYESFGETKGGVHDLAPVLTAMREGRRVYISAEDADVETTFELPVPPASAWQYWVDPIERQRWACRQFGKDPDEVERNAQGRHGCGTKVHCGHGPGPVWGFRECIDWRPFTYFTSRTTTPVAGAFVRPQPATETVEFQPGEQSTRIVWRFRVTNRSRISLLALRVFLPFWLAFWRRAGAALISIAEEDAAIAGVDEQGVAEGSVARVTRHF